MRGVDDFGNSDCWDLFERRLILREAALLSRAVQSIQKAQKGRIPIPLDSTQLETILGRLERDIEHDQTLLKDTIDMVLRN